MVISRINFPVAFRVLSIIFILCLLLFAIGIYHKNSQVDSFYYVVDEFSTSHNVESCANKLPCNKLIVDIDKKMDAFIGFEIPVSDIKNLKNGYLYIPFYRGRAVVDLMGEIIYQDDRTSGDRPLSSGEGLLIDLPADLSDYVTATLNFRFTTPNNNAFFQLSEVYIGEIGDFQTVSLVRRDFSTGVRDWLWKTLFLGVLALLALFIVNGFDLEFLPILTISIVIFGFLSPDSIFLFDISGFSIVALKLSPLFVVALWQFYSTKTGFSQANGLFIWFVAVLFSIFIFFLDFLLVQWPMLSELIIALPVLILGLVFNIFWGFRLFVFTGGFWSLTWASGILSLVVCIIHDLASRFGVFGDNLSISPIGVLILYFLLMLLFGDYVWKARENLSRQKQELLNKLMERESQLAELHGQEVRVVQKESVEAERRKINRDLHDGVLTYLSLISARSECSNSSKEIDILHLAESAAREIRFIVDSDDPDEQTVMMMLGSFHEQIIQPVINSGVVVDWNVLAFFEVEVVSSNQLLNLFRIMQELIHNAVFRAYCTHLVVEASFDGSGVPLIIVENSGGNPLSLNDKYGNGISNMRQRAKLIGVQFSIEPTKTGARVVLEFGQLNMNEGLSG
jgi:signal transduction histidine kinase